MTDHPAAADPAPDRRVALVTGAATGIGRAVVDELVARGHLVVGTWHRTEPPAITGCRYVRCDVRDRDDLDVLVDEVEATEGPIDVFVGNAAVLRDGMSFRMTDEQFDEVLAVDLKANAHLAERLIPGMCDRGWGRTVFVSSVGGIVGSASQANYAAAKAALHGLARTLAVDAAADGVTVNVVAPGPIDTELMRSFGEKHYAAFSAVVPAGRMGEPREVASVIGFLASEAASFVTGVVLPVDGGLLVGDGFVRSNRERVALARRAGRLGPRPPIELRPDPGTEP